MKPPHQSCGLRAPMGALWALQGQGALFRGTREARPGKLNVPRFMTYLIHTIYLAAVPILVQEGERPPTSQFLHPRTPALQTRSVDPKCACIVCKPRLENSAHGRVSNYSSCSCGNFAVCRQAAGS